MAAPPVQCAHVDGGYRGHDADKSRVFVSWQKRGVTPTIDREIRRRASIEPVIGHLKSDGHLGRNFLAGTTGDVINVVLAAAGHNLRLFRHWLIRLLSIFISLIAISGPAASTALSTARRALKPSASRSLRYSASTLCRRIRSGTNMPAAASLRRASQPWT
jgi:hypothetical protein